MSGSDPRGTHNVDNDGGPSGPRRRGLELVRRSETRMSEQNVRVEFRELIVRIDTELRVRSVYVNMGLQ
jgi:hypothetical protein